MALLLFFDGMGGVIRGEVVGGAVAQRFEHRGPVGGRTNRRIHLQPRAVLARDLLGIEVNMLRRHFDRQTWDRTPILSVLDRSGVLSYVKSRLRGADQWQALADGVVA